MFRAFTYSSQPMRTTCDGINFVRDGYLKNYRACWTTRGLIRITSNLLFCVISGLFMHYFHSQAAILKTKQQLNPVELLLVDVGNMS